MDSDASETQSVFVVVFALLICLQLTHSWKEVLNEAQESRGQSFVQDR